jgi:hypothetical protein
MVRFWLVSRGSEDRLETAYFAARLALAEQVAFEAGLEKFSSLDGNDAIYWFEGTMAQVVRAVSLLGDNYGLTGLGVEVSDKEMASKWPSRVRSAAIAVSESEIPGKGDRRLHESRRQEARSIPEPDLESEMKRGFMPR